MDSELLWRNDETFSGSSTVTSRTLGPERPALLWSLSEFATSKRVEGLCFFFAPQTHKGSPAAAAAAVWSFSRPPSSSASSSWPQPRGSAQCFSLCFMWVVQPIHNLQELVQLLLQMLVIWGARVASTCLDVRKVQWGFINVHLKKKATRTKNNKQIKTTKSQQPSVTEIV